MSEEEKMLELELESEEDEIEPNSRSLPLFTLMLCFLAVLREFRKGWVLGSMEL